jgi:tripartite ATP-independent transporter DctM subunit
MSPFEIGVAGFAALTVLIWTGMHISTALLLVAFVGTAWIRGDWDLAGTMLAQAATDAITEYEFGTVPLFVLMGFLVMVAGVGRDSYRVAHRMLRSVPGGLGHATVVGNAIFSAITGITVAAVVLFTKLAVPEMLARGWRPRLAVGIVAGSAMLGMLIPPSLLMIVYAVLTETSVGDIYTAGIVPGVILTVAFMAAIWLIAKWRPDWVGEGPHRSADARRAELLASEIDGAGSLARMLAPIVSLVLLVLGGMYGGLFTATEAGAVGAFGALVIALMRRSLDARSGWSILIDTGYVTASLILIIAAAAMFSRFLAISGLPGALGDWVEAHRFSLLTVMAVYVVVVLLLGTALDSTSTVLITVPVFAPLFKAMGADLVWVGVITMIAVEIGLITPPLGMSPFVVKTSLDRDGLGRELTLGDIYIGAAPFAAAALVVVVLLVLFPKLALGLV